MAQEKARRPRARKTDDVAPKAKAATKPRTRKRAVAAVEAALEAVATYAYHLWENGEPGDALEHWLRAERELAA
jgi:hypothetical protein